MHPYCAYITHQFFGSYKRGWYLLWINMCLYANRQWSHITARLLSWYTDILWRCSLIRHTLYHFEILPLSKPKHIIYIFTYILQTLSTPHILWVKYCKLYKFIVTWQHPRQYHLCGIIHNSYIKIYRFNISVKYFVAWADDHILIISD